MGQRSDEKVKRAHLLFVDDLKIYQENHLKLEIVNKMIVKASMDTGACYGVKKCAEIVLIRWQNDQRRRLGCVRRQNGSIRSREKQILQISWM